MDPLTLALLFGGSAAISAIGQIFAAKTAATAQTDAASQATDAELAMFGISKATLQPFVGAGVTALDMLQGTPAVAAVAGTPAVAAQPAQNYIVSQGGHTREIAWDDTSTLNAQVADGWTITQQGHGPTDAVAATADTPAIAATPGALQDLTAPITMDQATLEATPGYQWQLGQGVKSTTNKLAALGQGPTSGAAIKGAESYAEGLASSNYQQQFANALANKQMEWTALSGTAQIGENAAANTGTGAISTGSSVGSNITGAGAATAGSDLATANAITGVTNALTTSALLSNARSSDASRANGGLY